VVTEEFVLQRCHASGSTDFGRTRLEIGAWIAVPKDPPLLANGCLPGAALPQENCSKRMRPAFGITPASKEHSSIFATRTSEPWDSSLVRRVLPWALLGVLTIATVLGAGLGIHSEPILSVENYLLPGVPGTNYVELTGLPIAVAKRVATSEGVRLFVMKVPAQAPAGQVLGQDLNFQKDQTVVVSTGPLQDSFRILSPATVPPVHRECAGGLALDEDGNVGPLVCHGGVNVGAWEAFARIGIPVLALGRDPTELQVLKAICASGAYTSPMNDSAYQLAEEYYGWKFGEQLFEDYVYGLHGKRCAHLNE
jgi:hypothetical protein